MTLVALFLAAFTCAVSLTPVVRLAALRLGVVDHPERRKMHHVPIPLLGGAAIIIPFFGLVAVVATIAPEMLGDEMGRLRPILAGAAVIAAVGIYDDARGMKVWSKFLFQFFAAIILVVAGLRVTLFTNPLGTALDLGWVGIPVTVLWVVGVTNAMNLIDGLDGLAAGIGVIASLSLCAVAASADHPMVGILALVLAGATLGFLPFNTYPARIFLGDTGSMFLGFLLASLGLAGSLKASTATILILPIVVLGVPVLDTLWAILRRTQLRVSPFKADRNHLHHRLVRVGLHHRHVVLILYFVCAFLGVSAYLIVHLPLQTASLFVGLLAGGGMMGAWTLKYIEEHVEERIGDAAAAGTPRRVTPPPELPPSLLWQSNNGGKSLPLGEFQLHVCEIGVFHDGAASSPSFAAVAREIREVLGRRLKIFAVGAFMQEDRRLLVIVKSERIDAKGREMLREALVCYFAEQGERWGEGKRLSGFRWLREAGVAPVVPPVDSPVGLA